MRMRRVHAPKSPPPLLLLLGCLSAEEVGCDEDRSSLAIPNRLTEFNRGKTLFKSAPLGFQPGRELKVLAKRFYRFVNGESWWIRCQFKQDASGFAKVDRMKVDPVPDWGYVQFLFDQKPRSEEHTSELQSHL